MHPSNKLTLKYASLGKQKQHIPELVGPSIQNIGELVAPSSMKNCGAVMVGDSTIRPNILPGGIHISKLFG